MPVSRKNKHKIAFFEIQGWEKPFLRKALAGHELLFFKEPLTVKNVNKAKGCTVVSVFIYSQITNEVIEKIPTLKLVTTRSTGFDHVNSDLCKKKKIVVCNVPFYGENTVAEHTFALILALSRNVHKSYMRSIQNNFSIEGLIGFDLKGKTLGVVGAGHIGLHVIRIAKGFGMNVIAYDPNQNNFLAEVMNFKYAKLDDVLKKSDIITIHVPYNKFTHHLINAEKIKLLKKGAILINTARGGIIDTDALLLALDKKIIAGAGLDVLEGEEHIQEEKQLLYEGSNVESLREIVRDKILLSKDNVVFTPHIGFYSHEALERIIHTSAENIVAFFNNKPQNLVC